MHMSKRIRTTLTLDDEVVNRAKELGINLSAAAERGIIDYIKEIEYIRSKRKNSPINDNSSDEQFPKLRNHSKKIKRTYGDLNPSIRLRRPEGYPDYLIGP